MAGGVLRGVLQLAEGHLGRFAEYLRAKRARAFEVPPRVGDGEVDDVARPFAPRGTERTPGSARDHPPRTQRELRLDDTAPRARRARILAEPRSAPEQNE